VRHRQPKGPDTDRPSLKPPRHTSTPQLLTAKGATVSQGEELTFTILLSDLCNFTMGL
jgi:hypothetical protein